MTDNVRNVSHRWHLVVKYHTGTLYLRRDSWKYVSLVHFTIRTSLW